MHTHAQPLHTHAQPSPSDLRGTVQGVHTFQMPMRPPSSACMPDPTLFWDTSTSAARVFGQREHRRCDHHPRERHPLMPSLPRLRTVCACVPIALVGPREHNSPSRTNRPRPPLSSNSALNIRHNQTSKATRLKSAELPQPPQVRSCHVGRCLSSYWRGPVGKLS